MTPVPKKAAKVTRTTVWLDPALRLRARQLALVEHTTLRALIEEGLRLVIAKRRK